MRHKFIDADIDTKRNPMNSRDYDVDNVMEDSLMMTAIGALVGAIIVCAALVGAIFYMVGAW